MRHSNRTTKRLLMRLFPFFKRKATRRLAVRWLIENLVSMHDAREGILITGGPGSGKTSFVGAMIARKLLLHGCGGLILCVKPDETDLWQRYSREAGREGDFIRVSPISGHHFDPLQHELTSPGGSPDVAAHHIQTIVRVTGRNSGSGDEGQFWDLASATAGKHAVAALWLGTGTCSVGNVYQFIESAPESLQQKEDAAWQASSFCFQCLSAARKLHPNNPDFQHAAIYYLNSWPGLSDRTRSIVKIMQTNALQKLLTGDVGRLVTGTGTPVSPADALAGKLLCIDYPILRYRESAQLLQLMFKLGMQRAALRSDPTANRPDVFIWADECPWFAVPEDDCMTAAVSRQSRLIQVNIGQNYPLLISAIGGDKAKPQVDAWAAAHMTHIICANACPESNRRHSEMLGQSLQMFMSGHRNTENYNIVDDFMGFGSGGSAGWSERFEHDIRPEDIAKLRKPSASHPAAEAIVFQGGRKFANGKTWQKTAFRRT